MTYCTRHTVELQCHPAIRAPSVRGIQVQVGWEQGGALALTFSLTGDVVRLRIPTPQPSRRADGLWQHTCFEAFIAVEGGRHIDAMTERWGGKYRKQLLEFLETQKRGRGRAISVP